MTVSEEQLIKDAQSNNESFIVLYDRYYAGIYGYIFRRTLDAEKSKDITSEVFLKALVNIGKFRWKGIPFSAWLFRIATNEMNMADRMKKYQPRSLEYLMSSEELKLSASQLQETELFKVEKEIEANREFIEVQKCLLLLPLPYQEVISLRFFEDKSIKEIALILNKKEGTIKSLLSRGIDKLKKVFEDTTK